MFSKPSIKSIAELVRQEYLDGTEPKISIQKLAEDLDISVRYSSTKNLIASYDKKGVLFLINNLDNNRFLGAVGIGHLLLHTPLGNSHLDRKLKIDFKCKDFSNNMRSEATCFAANLLLPEKLFTESVELATDSHDYCNILNLAEAFGVTKGTIITRGCYLGEFSWMEAANF